MGRTQGRVVLLLEAIIIAGRVLCPSVCAGFSDWRLSAAPDPAQVD